MDKKMDIGAVGFKILELHDELENQLNNVNYSPVEEKQIKGYITALEEASHYLAIIAIETLCDRLENILTNME